MEGRIIPRRVDFDAAIELTNWRGILVDLEFVRDACDRLLRTDESDPVLRRALFDAALVAYARCFEGNEGVRVGLDESDLEGMGEGKLLAFHRFFIQIREKHIAHSVNEFEYGVIGVVDQDGQITLVDYNEYMIGLPDKSIAEFKEVAEYLIIIVSQKRNDAGDRVEAKYKSLTPDQVAALPTMKIEERTPSEVSQSREGLKRRQRRRGG